MKKLFLPEDGSTTMTFRNEDEVLEYLGSKVRQERAWWRAAGGGATTRSGMLISFVTK